MPSDRVRQFFERDLPAKAAAEVGRLFASEGSIAFNAAKAAHVPANDLKTAVRVGF